MTDLIVRAPGDGEAFWFLDTLMQVKLPAAHAGGAMVVFEQLAPPGSATPMHRHDSMDESFYVLEGEVVFHGPAGPRRCGPGAFVSVPRGTVHAFRVGDGEPARLIVITSGADFEHFVRAVSTPASDAALPPAGPPPGPDDLERLAALGAEHDVVLVGPAPPAS